ncbi:MAG: hypothetical protein EP319_15945 [Deltaproteobacteria bacterium]|nr:MAG: hypothetical protein EP319_15945 [Deltaproteobacteria bacterium]
MKNLAILALVIFAFLLGYRLGTLSPKVVSIKEDKKEQKNISHQEVKDTQNEKIEHQPSPEVVEKKVDDDRKKESYVSRLTNILKDNSLLQAALDECEEKEGEGYICHQVKEYYLYTGKYKFFKDKLFTKCSQRDFKTCRNLMHELTNKERKQLEDITYSSCMKNNNAEACDIFGTLSGWEMPSKRSLSIKKRACELDEEKCLQYAFYLERAADKTAAVFVRKGCLGSQKESYNCKIAADYFLKKGQIYEASEMLDFGCSNGDKNACGDLYHLYLGTKQTNLAEKLKTEICKIKDDASWHFGCR